VPTPCDSLGSVIAVAYCESGERYSGCQDETYLFALPGISSIRRSCLGADGTANRSQEAVK
jgi:hypothetical protein